MKYIVTVDITHAHGTREYSVEADSPEEAIAKTERGDAVCVSEQMEAEQLDFESAEAEEVLR